MEGVVAGLLCAASWAVGSVMIRDLSKKLDPFTLNAPRALAGGLALFVLTLATGRTQAFDKVTLEKLLFLVGSMGIGGGFGDSLYVASIARLGVTRAFPLASTYPALTLVFAVLFLDEDVSLAVVAGLLLVLCGVLLISRVTIQPDGDGSPRAHDDERTSRDDVGVDTVDVGRRSFRRIALSPEEAGVLAAMLASVCWAASGILVARGVEGLDSIVVASIRTPALAVGLWGVVATRNTFHKLRSLSRSEWTLIVVGGIVGWGLGSMFFVMSVGLVGATRAAILTSTSPLFAIPLSIVFLKEKANAAVLLGTACVVVGVMLAA